MLVDIDPSFGIFRDREIQIQEVHPGNFGCFFSFEKERGSKVWMREQKNKGKKRPSFSPNFPTSNSSFFSSNLSLLCPVLSCLTCNWKKDKENWIVWFPADTKNIKVGWSVALSIFKFKVISSRNSPFLWRHNSCRIQKKRKWKEWYLKYWGPIFPFGKALHFGQSSDSV